MIKYFPQISNYNFGITGGIKTVKNIFTSVNITVDDLSKVKEELAYSGERPEQASYRMYNNFNYYWILLLLNGIKNPFNWNTVLGQNSTNEDLERFDTRVLQFSNSSPFIPTEQENGITFNGIQRDLFEPEDINSYTSISGVDVGDTILFETGGGVNKIKCLGAGVLPSSSNALSLESMGIFSDWYHHGQCLVPVEFDNQINVKNITAGKKISCALDKDGRIHCWGDNNTISSFLFDTGKIGAWNFINDNYISSMNINHKNIKLIDNKLIVIDKNNLIKIINDNGSETNLINSLYPSGLTGSKTSWFFVDESGDIGGIALLSNGTIRDVNTFAPAGLTLTDVSCGNQFCIGIMGNGGLTGWGADNYGQLSNIPGGTGFVEIATNYDHILALKNTGTVYAWGLSAHGQCNVPDKTFSTISAGKKHSAAITTNNEVCVWGAITKFGFAGPNTAGIEGITYSDYSMTDYSIYGKYDNVESGENHVILTGLTGTSQRFYGIVTDVDNNYVRLTCKIFGGSLGITDELFFDEPTGTIVTVIRGGLPIFNIHHKLLGIQKQKNTTIEIQSDGVVVPLTTEVWKTIYIVNYNTPEKDTRLITLQKIYDRYNLSLKNKFYYISNTLIQKIDFKIQQDILNGLNLNYKLSELND